MNSIEYLKKNFKAFIDIINKGSTNEKKIKKEASTNPFGVAGLTSRNAANKENYGG